MARASERLEGNAPGSWFVDASCIDCDLCRQIAPATFVRSDAAGQSIVGRQPGAHDATRRAAMALVTCPTSSIGTSDKSAVVAASRAFPEVVDGDVMFSGYASESSFGASSYFVRRPRGNVLVDSPRAAKPLITRLRALGGVRTIVLSHRDDVADQGVFASAFGAERVMHGADVSTDTLSVERRIEGNDAVDLDDELTIVPVPGHTRGSIALIFRETYLFSGDHLWASDDEPGELDAGRNVCWYSWKEQTRSMERLLDYRFSWVLPGHGRRFRAQSAGAMRSALERLIGRMKRC